MTGYRQAQEFPFVVRVVGNGGTFAGFDTEEAALECATRVNGEAETLGLATRYEVLANPDPLPV